MASGCSSGNWEHEGKWLNKCAQLTCLHCPVWGCRPVDVSQLGPKGEWKWDGGQLACLHCPAWGCRPVDVSQLGPKGKMEVGWWAAGGVCTTFFYNKSKQTGGLKTEQAIVSQLQGQSLNSRLWQSCFLLEASWGSLAGRHVPAMCLHMTFCSPSLLSSLEDTCPWI